MAYDANVAALQNVVNRFVAVGFVAIPVDGVWGPKTQQGVYTTLGLIQRGTCAGSGCPSDDASSTAEGLVARWDGTPSTARGLQEFLNRVADDMGLAHVAAPMPASHSGGIFPNTVALPTSPFHYGGASIMEAWTTLPLWQRIVLGVAAGFGLLWIHKKYRDHQGAT